MPDEANSLSFTSNNSLLLYAETRLHELLNHYHPSRKAQNDKQKVSKNEKKKEDQKQENEGTVDRGDKQRRRKNTSQAQNVTEKEIIPRKWSQRELLQYALKDMNLKRFSRMYKDFLLKTNSSLVIRTKPLEQKEKQKAKEREKEKQNKDKKIMKRKSNNDDIEGPSRDEKRSKGEKNCDHNFPSSSLICFRTKSKEENRGEEINNIVVDTVLDFEQKEVESAPMYGFVANHKIYIWHVFFLVCSMGGDERLNQLPYFKRWAQVANDKIINLPRTKISLDQNRGQKLQAFYYRYELDRFSTWLCKTTKIKLQDP